MAIGQIAGVTRAEVGGVAGRVIRRRIDRDRPATPEDDPGLRALSRSAQRLIGALEAGADEAALREFVVAYVGCAAARGISRERIHDALELLVHDHARVGATGPQREAAAGGRPARGAAARHQATAHVLDLVLRLASGARTTSAPERREAT